MYAFFSDDRERLGHMDEAIGSGDELAGRGQLDDARILAENDGEVDALLVAAATGRFERYRALGERGGVVEHAPDLLARYLHARW